MNTSYGSNLESDSILDLLREFHSEAENILAHLSEIDLECQEDTHNALQGGGINVKLKDGLKVGETPASNCEATPSQAYMLVIVTYKFRIGRCRDLTGSGLLW